MAELRSTLRDAVRKLAFNTSVDQLKKSGVKKVNVLGIVSEEIDEPFEDLRERVVVSSADDGSFSVVCEGDDGDEAARLLIGEVGPEILVVLGADR